MRNGGLRTEKPNARTISLRNVTRHRCDVFELDIPVRKSAVDTFDDVLLAFVSFRDARAVLDLCI